MTIGGAGMTRLLIPAVASPRVGGGGNDEKGGNGGISVWLVFRFAGAIGGGRLLMI